MTINWKELTQAYNERKGTNYSTPKEMRKDLYIGQKIRCKKMGKILSVSYSAILVKLKEDGIKMRVGKRRSNTSGLIKKTFLETPEQETKNMDLPKSAEEPDYSPNYLDVSIRKHDREHYKQDRGEMSLKNIKGKKLEGMFANMQIKGMDTDEKIRRLSEKDGKMFNKVFTNNVFNRKWCKQNKIDYVNPNHKLAREKTYQEMCKKMKM